MPFESDSEPDGDVVAMTGKNFGNQQSVRVSLGTGSAPQTFPALSGDPQAAHKNNRSAHFAGTQTSILLPRIPLKN